MSYKQVIVVGGGLAGFSAAHTVLENGGSVLILDKMPFCGGNSVKATSGINGAGTSTQRAKNIPDTPEIFEQDCKVSAKEGYNAELTRVLTHTSGPAVDWLTSRFELDLSLVSQLGGHSFPRTHRGKERFPGMTITYALIDKFEKYTETMPERARLINKATVTRLFTDANGAVTGVEYEKDGKKFHEEGAVILATGGFGADFSADSLLAKVSDAWRSLSAWNDVPNLPNLMTLPTTNGEHCTGDGIKMAMSVGADTVDMEAVQVHPTGLVHPDEPNAKVLFLAAEALRGCGGLLLNAAGERFCDELGKRDYVTGRMWNSKGPFRLVLNSKSSNEIIWHCKHYMGRGLMKHFKNGEELAKEMGLPAKKLQAEFEKYNAIAASKKDPFGKKYFQNLPYTMSDDFHVAVVTPVVHYTMGGLKINGDSEVISTKGAPIPGLYCSGEVMGGVHGKNRLGGNSLLDCVAFGRVAGGSATRFLLQHHLSSARSGSSGRLANIAGHLAPVTVSVDGSRVQIDIQLGGSASAPAPSSAPSSSGSSKPSEAPAAPAPAAAAAPAPAAKAAASADKKYTPEEVAKHNTDKDCWVIVNGQVLDVTSFLNDHPGGKKAIMLYAGKDATEEFNMLHKPDVVKKYAPDSIIGSVAK